MYVCALELELEQDEGVSAQPCLEGLAQVRWKWVVVVVVVVAGGWSVGGGRFAWV
jgi:hypothetical protein